MRVEGEEHRKCGTLALDLGKLSSTEIQILARVLFKVRVLEQAAHLNNYFEFI